MKVNSLPGKVKTFSGPTSVPAIAKQIAIDAQENGLEITAEVARHTLQFFFRNAVFNMAKGNFVDIEQLGTFGMTKKRMLEFQEKDVIEYEKKTRINRYNYRRKYYVKKLKENFIAFNAMRRSKGLDEWKFIEYKKVHKHYIPRKLGTNRLLRKK